ncbi:Chemotaxis protein CheW [bioreactor metagenome]|uniref:Chemotaxis protein CheW n=1 Tax=bioreactor metagenome TaxID=1076179 RepID=A0A644SVR6_9ZZZZ|nr:chemotaxis protein CheW [Negativicutes bacterium]
MASEQLVVFQLAAEEYAIPISQVKEIIRYNGTTKLPNAPGYMDGIINLRGKVIAVVDLAKKFAVATERSTAKQALIVETAGQEVGLVVDAVTEVIRLDETQIEAANGIAQSSEFIRSIGKADKRLLIILDLNKLFTQEELAVLGDSGD